MHFFSKQEPIVEKFHGVNVADPYRWLEEAETVETKEWIEAQNLRTRKFFDRYSDRKKLKDRLETLMNHPKHSIPQKHGDYYYFHKNDGLQNQPVFYRSKSFNFLNDLGEVEVVIDPNKLDNNGTTAITNISFNQSGSMLTYGISYNGSDWQEFKIKNLKTLEDLPDILKWCKFSNIAWSEDGSGFFYNRFPRQNFFDEENFYNSVYWHTVGTQQSEDMLIYEDRNNRELLFLPELSNDNKYLILRVYKGTEPKSKIFYRNVNSEGDFIRLINDGEDDYSFIGNDDETFYIYTNNSAPKGRLIAVDLKHPDRENWQTVIPETSNTIAMIKLKQDYFVVTYLQNAYHNLKLFDKKGNLKKEPSLPPYITITDIQGENVENELFIQYTSYLHPPKTVQYMPSDDHMEEYLEPDTPVLSNQFETKQVFYRSKNGTEIPMFITYKKGLKLDGNNPTLLFGYGGYNISLTPTFSPSQILWMENGGVYVVANLRGGGEFGEDWHLAGILEKKQNVFDDFIAAAEWLISNNYTNSQKLAIMGRSNGGLLVGACITQRPELFGAALCLVPVTDMLRFHLFTVGHFWTTELGNAEEDHEHFKFMYEYSPLHNVKDSVEYPPTLITTADTDDRVVPLHAKKFTAALQAAQSGDNPILLRIEKNAGHGLGKPTSKILEEQTDLLTFLISQLKLSF